MTALPSAPVLAAIAANLDAKTSPHTANTTVPGLWKRIATALEEGAGVANTRNDNQLGYMERAALAAEAKWGGSGAEENTNQRGLMKRLVDAFEISAGAATTGSYSSRLLASSSLVAFGPSVLSPTFYDAFDTSGNLNGRTGWQVLTRSGFSGQVNAIAAANGKAGGTAGTAAYAVASSSVIDVNVTTRMGISPTGSETLVDHATIDQVTDANRNYVQITGGNSVSGGLTTGVFSIGTKGVTLRSLSGVRSEVGDNLRREYRTSGGTTTMTLYLNGRAVMAPLDVTPGTTALATLAKKFGILGSAGAATLDYIKITDPAAEGDITLFAPGRVAALKADGSVDLPMLGDYTGGVAPSSLQGEAVNAATDVTLGRSSLTSFLASGGTWSGLLSISSATLSGVSSFYLRAARTGLVTSGGAVAEAVDAGPIMYPGYVFGSTGQSLNTAVTAQTITTDTYAAPTTSFHVTGTPTNTSTLGNAYDRRQLPISANTTAAAFATTFQTITGKPVAMSSGGVGGTSVSQRTVGTAAHNALIEALAHMGGRFSMVRHCDGQSDVSNASAYITEVLNIYADIATRNGGSVKVLMNPIAAGWSTAGGSDENWQNIRRAQWKLTQDYPSVYFYGAHTLDVQKADNLHLTANGYGEMARREAYAAAKALGLTTFDRNGPSLASVSRVSDSQVRCVYDLNGFDSLELANTSFASEFHGGMVFSTSSANNGTTITTKIYPTGATVDASPSGGQQGIDFSFPANTFPGTVYAWAAYGKDPFNPTNNATIQTAMATSASMIRGIKSGEPKVGLQPRFATNGADWISAA